MCDTAKVPEANAKYQQNRTNSTKRRKNVIHTHIHTHKSDRKVIKKEQAGLEPARCITED